MMINYNKLYLIKYFYYLKNNIFINQFLYYLKIIILKC